ncbi:MAG: acyl-CoA dehydrogenase family protein [Actinomycetota bacterium]
MVDRQVWRSAADIGFFSLRDDGPDMGLPTGTVDAALVALEVGRTLLPGPFTATMVAAEVLPEVRKGDLIATAVRRPRRGGALVEHPASADVLLVFDTTELRLVERRDVSWTAVDFVDPLTPLGVVDDLPGGALVADGEVVGQLHRFRRVLDAAEQAGLAARSCAESVRYAQERHQFGRPIGSFQAVKHILADMAVDTELARAATLYAAGQHDIASQPEAERSSFAALLVAEEAATKNAERAIQIWGAMGYAWETGLHCALRRAWAISQRAQPRDVAASLAELLMVAAGERIQPLASAATAARDGGVETTSPTKKGM